MHCGSAWLSKNVRTQARQAYSWQKLHSTVLRIVLLKPLQQIGHDVGAVGAVGAGVGVDVGVDNVKAPAVLDVEAPAALDVEAPEAPAALDVEAPEAPEAPAACVIFA